MTSKIISPLPSETPQVGHQGNKVADSEYPESPPAADLTSIRKKWNSRFGKQTIPSIPKPTVSTNSDSKTPDRKKLPELPAHGSLAGKAASAMALEDQQPSEKRKKTIAAIPTAPFSPDTSKPQPLSSEPSIFNLGNSTTTQLEIPQIPRTPDSDALTTETEAKNKATLSPIPIIAPPAVSIDLVRNQLSEPTKTKASESPDPQQNQPDSKRIATPTDTQEESATLPKTKTDQARPAAKHDRAPDAPAPAKSKTPEYTDEDLREALRPIIEPCVDKFLYTPTHGIHTFLEPMLRSTVRRAIAEQMEDASPFNEVSGWDKFAWKMRAMLSSRTYEDVIFDQTKRYQVEEVFLLRPQSRSLISYASNDPMRHCKPSKVNATVKNIADKTAEKESDEKSTFTWENNRQLILRTGEHCILAAIVHGSSNAILKADLDYALRQAEERFGETLEEENDIHLQILQPLLESCLLIQSPAIPN